MPNEYRYHPVDGRMMTTDEIAAMLGLTKAALYIHKSKLGGVSMQCVVDMFRSNMIGNDRCKRYLIEGRWMTTGQIAGMLGIKTHSLVAWRNKHKRPDGTPAPMDAAIEYFRGYQTGERKRHNGEGGRPCKKHMVDGRAWTVKDVCERYHVTASSVYTRLQALDHDMWRVLAYYREKERRMRAVEQRKKAKAERQILRILGY